MGFLGRHTKYARAFVLAAAVAIVALLPLRAGTLESTSPREVVLVVRNMAFYLNGDGTENPTLRLKAGERIRIVLRNEEPGVTHDFAVTEWNVATRPLNGSGRDSVTFRVPDRVGSYEYLCNPHASMMRGIIEVK